MKYPENWVAPYVILWRSIWIVPIYTLRILLTILIGICYGSRDARWFWNSL